MVVALACIVGLIYGVVFVLKRLLPGAIRSGAERVDLQVLGQLNVGSRQRVAVIRVQERTLVVGITEGSINTLAELTPAQPAAQKEADDPKIFADLLTLRKDGAAAQRNGSGKPAAAAQPAGDSLSFRPLGGERKPVRTDDPGEGPSLFAPGERPPR
ncbi:MAG TPA: flagellar biosynthetic protein FliO [Humidesulfovibrio sp.]|uniref:flagellar biosynthetic protein FliO n=1 Tax=Humidesulfovibrio sp. TaxID=2910988 RepID=UPI002B5C2B6E|nr:flagellar biosynthetic protein FliO [Humidesulfovibrio sp.]HWR05197.1 flagellar biosynthetic protein FliO [Humidesulfovibrio sp.]